jgi:hypothetical protein
MVLWFYLEILILHPKHSGPDPCRHKVVYASAANSSPLAFTSSSESSIIQCLDSLFLCCHFLNVLDHVVHDLLRAAIEHPRVLGIEKRVFNA